MFSFGLIFLNLLSASAFSKDECCSFDALEPEMHWQAHSSCRSCLRSHERCIKECVNPLFECTVQGVNRYGYQKSFSAQAPMAWQAEDLALQACRNRLFLNCKKSSQKDLSETVSRIECDHSKSTIPLLR